jgi:hypothetical protein
MGGPRSRVRARAWPTEPPSRRHARILLIAIGAILKSAVTAHTNGVSVQTAGFVPLIVGPAGLVLSILYTFYWTRREAVVYDDARTVRPPPPPAY